MNSVLKGMGIILVCRNCGNEIGSETRGKEIENLLQAFFSREDWKKVLAEKLTRDTKVSVPVCLRCFDQKKEVKGDIILSQTR